jgi:hypothetical protein
MQYPNRVAVVVGVIGSLFQSRDAEHVFPHNVRTYWALELPVQEVVCCNFLEGSMMV